MKAEAGIARTGIRFIMGAENITKRHGEIRTTGRRSQAAQRRHGERVSSRIRNILGAVFLVHTATFQNFHAQT